MLLDLATAQAVTTAASAATGAGVGGGSGGGGEDKSCVVCWEKPRNATIVHGDSGHGCCCLGCAKELKARQQPCPVCRLPIDLVIRQYS